MCSAISLSHLRQLLQPRTASQRGNSPNQARLSPPWNSYPHLGFQAAGPAHFQLAAWYKNKHWWKRNAPIIGGAAGGALIGGLVGGGKGVIIGGAAGGGGGYLYKRLHHPHYHQPANAYYYQHPANTYYYQHPVNGHYHP